MGSLGFCNLDEAFNSNNLNVKKKKNSKNKKKQTELLDSMAGTLEGTFINNDNIASNKISGTSSTIAASVPISNSDFDTKSEFKKIKTDSILSGGNESVQMDKNTNKEILLLNKQIENLTKLVNNMSNNNNNSLIETFTNKPLFKFDNHQFNELLLFIFAGIFIILLFDYIYKLGKKSY